MNEIFFQNPLSPSEREALQREFFPFRLLSLEEGTPEEEFFSDPRWSRVEIFYGEHLPREAFERNPHLRWVHVPGPFLDKIEIEKTSPLLLSNTQGEHSKQMGEFVLAAVLAFAKQLFFWWDQKREGCNSWTERNRRPLWTLPQRTFLQVGLGVIGTEIARCAQQQGFKVWGSSSYRTFSPYCHKTFSLDNLRSLLPSADVVSLCLPKRDPYIQFFGKRELELMKEDAILSIVGSGKVIDEEALVHIAQEKPFRGVLLDAFHCSPLPENSPLWKLPSLLITPEIASFPEAHEGLGLRTFRYNLRHYMRGNYHDMKFLVDNLSTI